MYGTGGQGITSNHGVKAVFKRAAISQEQVVFLFSSEGLLCSQGPVKPKIIVDDRAGATHYPCHRVLPEHSFVIADFSQHENGSIPLSKKGDPFHGCSCPNTSWDQSRPYAGMSFPAVKGEGEGGKQQRWQQK